METIKNNQSYGQCRCCLTEGRHLDLSKDYCVDGTREYRMVSYSDIFVDCFNLFLCNDVRMTTLICTKCVRQLKDALLFKMKVLNSEKQLLILLNSGTENLTVYLNNNDVTGEIKEESDIKEEIHDNSVEVLQDTSTDVLHDNSTDVLHDNSIDVLQENSTDVLQDNSTDVLHDNSIDVLQDNSTDVLHDNSIYVLKDNSTDVLHDNSMDMLHDNSMDVLQHEPECIDEDEQLDFREKEFLNRFRPGTLQMLPTRSKLHTHCAGYFVELGKLKGKTITVEMVKRLLAATTKYAIPSYSSNRKKLKSPSEKMGHSVNIATLLTHSNLTAFKSKTKNGFPCFYCAAHFENLQLLQTHQKSHNKKDNLMEIVQKKYKPGRPDCLVVYAEITDLKCTVCDQSVSSLQELKSHLINIHKKTMYPQFTDRVIPFKISDSGYQCQVCDFFFETFGTIERHMNTHFRNFVCEECGAGFIAKNRLQVHKYTVHSNVGEFPCQICEKSFQTRLRLKIHFSLVHKLVKKVKCPKCPARFACYFVRQKHLVDIHGVTPIKYRCNVCDKAFSRRFYLSTHIKKCHLDEKHSSCQMCAYTCFSNTELTVHMVKQHGERLFVCPVCEKRCTGNSSLNRHLNVHR